MTTDAPATPPTDPAAPPATPPTDPAAPPATPPATPPADPAKDAKPQGAPEKYEDFELPEGAKLEAEELTAIQAFAKDLNLTQDQAQKLVTRDLERQAAADKAREDQANATRDSWEAASKADKEFGGDKFDENLALAKKVLDTFGDDELKQFLDLTGRGSHPSVIRAFVKVGRAISEDKLVPAGEQKPTTGRFYGNSQHAL